jgi:hypothetical protein
MGGVNSKGGPKGKLFAFLDQERGGCQGPKAWGPSPGCGVQLFGEVCCWSEGGPCVVSQNS